MREMALRRDYGSMFALSASRQPMTGVDTIPAG